MSNQPRYFPSIVKLNVGGQHFTTSLQTLTRDPNSMLAAMFSGRHELETTDGSFFIDRDGTYFRFILNYLRNGELILPDGATFLKELEAEAKFYQVQGILDELHRTAPKEFEEVGDTDERRASKSLENLVAYKKRMAFAIPSFTRWLCCFSVSFQMRQQRTYNHCCKKWWKHFWRVHWERLDK